MISQLRRSWEKNWPELHCALRAGMPSFVTSARPREHGTCIPVFCYHIIDPERFGSDLAFLTRNGYTTLDADELLAHMEGEQVAPPRSVVLTIDDGMLDLYTEAYPLLREYDATAVAFIAPGLHERSGAEEDDARRLCSWTEIEEMHLSTHVDFQSHTLEHRSVSRWPQPCGIRDPRGWLTLPLMSPMTLEHDLKAARTLLRERLQKEAVHLAFPQYEGTSAAVRAALVNGYRGLWWGTLAGRRGNDIGDPLAQIVRVSGEFLRRLPGEGRVSLTSILQQRALSRRPRSTPAQTHAVPAPSQMAGQP
jgi:hypothetical protein